MDFFQRAPPFLVQLQNILRKYPDGGQILKELLQNADDAKASEVIFVYDERHYGTEKLYSKELCSIQGPALLAYNNEVFTESDWDGIQKPGNSIKRKDPNTVGRFGLGFNSVYHITDHPAIFSGKNIGILDPQEIIFRRGGFLWNLERSQQFEEQLEDQFNPFRAVLEAIGRGSWNDILNNGFFKGTVFRFPFRLAPSEISDNIYTSERVQELFDSFISDSSISLLFLRHVTTVSLKRIGSDGVVTHLITVTVSTESLEEAVTADLTTGTHVKVTSLKSSEKEEKFKWLVTTNTVHGNLFPELVELSKKLYNKPSLDLAFPLTEEGIASFGGRLCCVLPLPDKEENQTGLPVIINGCFDLSDDRRSIKWIEVDQQHDEAAIWNNILIEKLLPVVYKCTVKNVMTLVMLCKVTAEVAYGIWPDPCKTQHKGKWHSVTRELSISLMNEKILQTADKACWVAATEAIFLFAKDENMQKCLEDLLLLLKKPLVKVPGHVHRTLMLCENANAKLNIVSPTFIRKLLHTTDWSDFPNEKKMLLLEYVISDGQYSDLLNLKLLPLSDGTFIEFQNTDNDGVAYIDSQYFPRTLLPGITSRFIPEDLSCDMLDHLKTIGSKRIYKNLVCLDEEVVCKALNEALPKTWHGGDNVVTWHPRDPTHPPVEWLSTFWAFLQRSDNILDVLEHQPLIPLDSVTENSTDIQLARLKKNTTLLFQEKDAYVLNNCLTTILKKVGCIIVAQENPWLWHKNLQLYILLPTPNNILKTFSNLNVAQIVQVFSYLPKEHIDIFCDYIAQAFSFTIQEQNILHQLPIFCSANNIKFSGSRMVPAYSLRAVDKCTIPPVPENLVFPDVLIRCRDETDRRLLQQMKISLLNASDVALLIVQAIQHGSYNTYESHAHDAMLWILRNGQILFAQNNNLSRVCKNLNFIPCNGKLTQASLLFDPKVELFQELLEPENFPPSTYNEDAVLMSLRALGLKYSIENLAPSYILQIANSINKEQDHVLKMKKAKAIVKVCNTGNVLSQFNRTDLNKLCNIAWVPVNSSNSQTVFSQPSELRNMTYSNIVEFSMHLTSEFNEAASRILGLDDLPPPEKVVEHLKILSENCHNIDHYSLYRKLHDIYKYIGDHCEQFHDNLLNMLIWNGEGFSRPNEIVLFYPEGLDLSSNVKKVPENFLIYKHLFTKCGVRSTLSASEVIEILYTLKHNIETRNSPPGTAKELKLAISILDWMKTNSVHGSGDLPIPIQTDKSGFQLKALSTSLFCDMDKMHFNNPSANYMDYHVVHEEVSPATARFLNIQLLSTKVLMPEYFEPWGPSESITLRIKNILREYSEHVEIFKEIIQNADDANSSICEFLVDMRQNSNSRQSLIDPDMANCHGPALWCYNNSKFTDNDFLNITRVGAATKEAKLSKIGKFGLGFNTVYHITDAPSIMSGSHVVIFDPNINHMKKHIPNGNNPGIKLNLQNNPEVLQIFPDQFQPFSNVFGCELNQPFNFEGTLIRLPFRTETEAEVSQICQQFFNEEQIEGFLETFENVADILLIFLKNVQRVTLSFLQENTCPKEQTQRIKVQRERGKILEVPQHSPLQKKQIDVSKTLGVSMNDVMGPDIIKFIVQTEVSTEEKHYLIQPSLGIKGSFQMFSESRKTKFSLPVAGVALPLKKNHCTNKWAPDLLDFNGMVFCFLPLPISSGFPFHLNGSFSVMSNRKSLWDTTEKGEWNKTLLCDAVLVALIMALSQLQILQQNGTIEDYQYYTFWPDIAKVKSQFTAAVKAFYQAVAFGFANELPSLFSNGQQHCTVKHACFLQLENTKDKRIGKLAKKVFSSVLQKPYLAVSLPEWVKKGFTSSDCFKTLLVNSFNWERFYREIVFENLHLLDTEDRNALILHAIDMQNKQIDDLLLSKPCIPSSLQGRLQFIVKLVHPEGKASLLYCKEEGRFPQGAGFLKPERMSRLQMMGMLKDTLPMAELMERACRIKDVWKHDRNTGVKQIGCVLDLLNDLLHQSTSNVSQKEFRNITFLPATSPESWCDEMQKIDLLKSTDVYHYKFKDLISMIKSVLSPQHIENFSKVSDTVFSFLGLDQPPTSEMVLSQLLQIYRISNLIDKRRCFQIAKTCYMYLNKLIQKQPNEAAHIRKKIDKKHFVYVDHDFASLDSVARKLPFDASPYLYKLPKEYEEFSSLWNCVELSEEFSVKTYTAALKKMATKHKKNPLPSDDMRVAVSIITHCGMLINDSADSCGLTFQKMFIPDQQGVLQHLDKIYFNDTPWLPCDKDFQYCHDLISRRVALKLGIKTKIHHTLQRMKVSDLSLWVSKFGAKEDLTTRIKNIISEYSAKKDILKELIQNADDSEATEIHFVLDSRTHQAVSTFGLDWNPLQGPALCIYNNKTFASKDIDGIQMLGIGGKGDRLDKTGKFGLGFNAVYHITDCPSFVTEDLLMCIFDPNCTFLPTADSDSPGGMFKLGHEFKETFKDVYNTFLPGMFDLDKGTIFRLPLRMANTVGKSRIATHTTSLEDIRELCRELEDDAESMILFLNNIKKITFSEISHTGDMEEILSISSEIDPSSEDDISTFQQKLSHLGKDYKHVFDAIPLSVSYEVKIVCGSKKPTHWLIAKQIGIDGENMVADLHSIYESLDEIVVPHGAVAVRLNHSIKGRAFCTLPLPMETGLPVHISGNFLVDSARRDICKEDGESPKTKWNKFLLSSIIPPVYVNLLRCLRKYMTKGRETLVFKILSSFEIHFLNDFMSYFPRVTKSVPTLWQAMVHQVYRTIVEKQEKLIPVYRVQITKAQTFYKHEYDQMTVHVEWSNIGHGVITQEPHFLNDSKGMTENKNLIIVLNLINMKLAYNSNSTSIFSELRAAGVQVLELSPKTLCNFLRKVPLHSKGKSLPMHVAETLLKTEENCKILFEYCCRVGFSHKATVDLQGAPLLVTEDDILQIFDRDKKKYYSQFSLLFPRCKHLFAKHCTRYTDKLIECGFLKLLSIQDAECFIKQHLNETYHISPGNSGAWPTLPDDDKDWFKTLWMFFESAILSKAKTEESIKTFKEVLSLFNDWTILPAYNQKHGNRTELLPLVNLKSTLCGQSDIAPLLFKMGFPKLNYSMIPLELISFISPYCMNTEDAYLVLEQLYSKKRDLDWNEFNDLEVFNILSFFLKGLKVSDNKKDFLHKLQALPLFENFQGKRQCLNMYQKIFILDSMNLVEFKRLFELDPKAIFLKNNFLNKDLSTFMHIPLLNEVKFLTEFILPHLPSIHEEEYLQVLKLILKIQHCPEYIERKPVVTNALKPLKVIKNRQGTLCQISQFYDHQSKLFSILGFESRFIPDKLIEEFQKYGYAFQFHSLLLDLGMKHQLTEEDIITTATKIEMDSKGNCSLNSLILKVESLFNYLLSMNAEELSTDFTNRLGRIKFIFLMDVDDKLKSFLPPYSKNTTTVALKGSLLNLNKQYEKLTWTSTALINPQKHLQPEEMNVLAKCGVVFKPPVDLVVQNIKNVCRASCESIQLQETRRHVLQQSYAFLQVNDSFDATMLADVPFILVDDKDLSESSKVVLNLSNENHFRPYLFKLPPSLAGFYNLFERIGVQAEATVFHYAQVLSTIFEDTTHKESLHGNLKKTVLAATKNLFHLLEEGKTKDLQNIETLYLLATDGKLYDSSTLVFNNCPSHKLTCQVSNTFMFFSFQHMEFVTPDLDKQEQLIKCLPVAMRPQLLSAITVETIKVSSEDFCTFGESCPVKKQLKDLFVSPVFHKALVSLLRSQLDGKLPENVESTKFSTMFINIDVICCCKLTTQLIYERKPLEGTHLRKPVFIPQNSEKKCTIYIDHDSVTCKTSQIRVLSYLARELNRLMDYMFTQRSITIFMEILHCENPDEIVAVLKDNHIWNNNTEQYESYFPNPGEQVPTEWYDALDMSILNSFKVGDYVGYMHSSEAGCYQYAIIIDELEPKEYDDCELKMYRIKLGEDYFVDVSIFDLYQFKRNHSHNSTALVLVENPSQQEANNDKWYDASLEEIKKEIDMCLQQIRHLPEDEQKKAIRRLYLKYHPDKNIEQKELSNEICKYLQQKIQEIKEGKKMSSGASAAYQPNFSSGFSGCWAKWNREASAHRTHRQKFSQRTKRDYNFWEYYKSSTKPNRQEAQRWLKQAECDLRAAEHDVGHHHTEWVFYKAHQAVKKALFAAQYMKHGKIETRENSSIGLLADVVSTYCSSLHSISKTVLQMQKKGVDEQKTQYPNFHAWPGIPNDSMPSGKEAEVIELATVILQKIKNYIH
ncbi:sacsin-like [Spea bombifrons]|uniref:sacsin-like n=1 Tax=Spea bombifrons TaxID=233779 RepID=UPI002349A8CB|nr:sacsin-like [Spea bombifrons]